MDELNGQARGLAARLRNWLDLTVVATIVALALSVHNFYRSYFYVNQQMDVTVTEVSYTTNLGELYATVAFSNGGNRDAAVLRVEPAIWATPEGRGPEWVALTDKVPDLPLVSPKTPLVVRAGGVEVVSLATGLPADRAERARVVLDQSPGLAFLGIRVATMNSDGNLYLLEHPVAQLAMDDAGRIRGAEPLIHRSLPGFLDVRQIPPGETLTRNKRTPFVWADARY